MATRRGAAKRGEWPRRDMYGRLTREGDLVTLRYGRKTEQSFLGYLDAGAFGCVRAPTIDSAKFSEWVYDYFGPGWCGMQIRKRGRRIIKVAEHRTVTQVPLQGYAALRTLQRLYRGPIQYKELQAVYACYHPWPEAIWETINWLNGSIHLHQANMYWLERMCEVREAPLARVAAGRLAR